MFHDIDIKLDHDLLEEHRETAIALKSLKAKEIDLRNQITDVLLDGLQPGTHNFSAHGMLIKAVKGLNYSFDTRVLQDLIDDEMLTPEELALIRWKPELRLADYKKANFETEQLEEALFVKPAQATLEIKLGE